jgi:signal peptidase II
MASKNSGGSLLPWIGIAAALVLFDQVTKAVIVRMLRLGESHEVNPVLDIVRWHNTGAAFSFLHSADGWQRWLFIGLAAVAAIFIVWMLNRHGGQRMFCWALALILGGAVGNVIDRLVHGYVVDFILVHYHDSRFPAFNVADSAITIGAGLLILDELMRVRRAK